MLIAQISDPHIKPEGQLAYRQVDTAKLLARAVEHVCRLEPRPDVVLGTGDLVDAGRAEEYRHLARLLAPLPMPVYLIPGNHDQREAMVASLPGHAYLPRSGFLHYVIDEHPLRLIALDTLVTGQPGGALGAERLAWLDARLGEAERPTAIFMHHPPFATGIEYMDGQGLADGEAMRGVLARHSHVEAVLCGHLHRPIHLRWAGTVVTTAPSPAHQVTLDLRAGAPLTFTMEPPAILLHVWRPDTGLVTHTSFIGEYAGPYPFYDASGKLID
jgi:3',5'-cyclic AMP phosphodiesterase CpdA